MSSSSSSSSGIGLCGMVFIVFLFLKLAEMGTVATWSWWWVTSPLWLPLGIVLSVIVVMALACLFLAAITSLMGGKKVRGRRRIKIK